MTDPSPISTFNHQKTSCRALTFSNDGARLYSGASDGSLHVTNTEGKLLLRKKLAHEEAINVVQCLSENLVASACDAGMVKVWDVRSRKCTTKFESADYISDLLHVDVKQTLISVSGGGSLCAFDLRAHKAVVSECQDDELTSITSVRDHKKIVVGTSSGTLLLFTYGQWGDCTDRFTKHTEAVNAMLPRGYDRILTASDGFVRDVNILPNEFRRTIAKTDVESMAQSADGRWVSTCGHDEVVRIWDTQVDAPSDEDEDNGASEDSGSDSDSDEDVKPQLMKPQVKRRKTDSKAQNAIDPFFADLD
jgi:WD repeat-containing protein 55